MFQPYNQLQMHFVNKFWSISEKLCMKYTFETFILKKRSLTGTMLPTWDKYWPCSWEQHAAARCSAVTGNHTAAEVRPPPAIHLRAAEVPVSLIMPVRTEHSWVSVFKQQPGSTEVHFHTLLLRGPAGCPSGSRRCTLWAPPWCTSPTLPASAHPWWPEGSIDKNQWKESSSREHPEEVELEGEEEEEGWYLQLVEKVMHQLAEFDD